MNHLTDELPKIYLANLYHQLDHLRPGTLIDLLPIKHPDQRAKYIAGVKVYIDDGHPEVEFNHDYTKVRRLRGGF